VAQTLKNLPVTVSDHAELVHKGGPGTGAIMLITPTAASAMAAFYSATAMFVTMLAGLLQGTNGPDPARGTGPLSRNMTPGQTSSYKHSSRHTPASFRTTNALNGARKIPTTSFTPLQLPPPRQRWRPKPPLPSSFHLLTN
jgi:hypothetical protein